MRLRYLHLPRCGPLADASVVFGREELVAQTLNLPRKGSLNFVVGVNGSGKSSLLRALYQTFRSLRLAERPALPLTIAWDFTRGTTTMTTLLHVSSLQTSTSFCATINKVPTSAGRTDWEEIVKAIGNNTPHPLVNEKELITGEDAFSSSLLQARLPKHLIAYSSGAIELWTQIDQPVFHPNEKEESHYGIEEERPPGWSMNLEWEEEQPIRITNVLTRYALKASGTAQSIPGAGQLGQLTGDTVERLQQELGPLETLRQKVFTNSLPRSGGVDDSIFHIQSCHLRQAGIILGLWQATKEPFDRIRRERDVENQHTLELLQGYPNDPKDARRILNKIDWFGPTHLSLIYQDAADRVSPRQHEELLCLLALADEVIALPRGRMRAVIHLGTSGQISLTEKLKDAFPYGIPSKTIEFIASRVDGCKTMAEALLRVFSEVEDIDATPLDVFSRLREWERSGLLEDITLTVKRQHRPTGGDGEPDDIVVTYDQLSDGEQMLLGRMGLLFLLRGQDGSLLLLDEPETHFNDVWKREIVEMVDTGLLNSTEANVIVATHTSIALTDAFAAEVTVLDKQEGQTTARGVSGGLFGTDPGEVNMNLFGADSSIGRRSVEILDQLLKTEWQGREEELSAILNVLGSSFHRAELRAILKHIRAANDGTASS